EHQLDSFRAGQRRSRRQNGTSWCSNHPGVHLLDPQPHPGIVERDPVEHQLDSSPIKCALALKYAFKPAHTVATQAYLCQHRIILLGSIIMDGPVYQGWYNSRKLPHFDGPSVTQFISFRLADSLPSDRLRQIKAELRALPLAQQGVERRRKMEYWIDRGLGCCALAHPQMAAVFLEG